MPTWLSILFALTALALTAGILVMTRRKRGTRNAMGFREMLRHPDKADRQCARRMGELQPEVPKDFSDDDIRTHIERLLDPWTRPAATAWLKAAGPRVVPQLMDSLRDHRIVGDKRPPDQPLGHSALDSIFKVLQELHDPRCISAVSAWLDDPDTNLRKEAALALGAVGSRECTTALRKALADEDEYVRSYAIMGLWRAIGANRIDVRLLGTLFDSLLPLMETKCNDFNGDAARLILRASPARGREALLSERILRPDNPYLVPVLRALWSERIEVPAEVLSRLEHVLSPLATSFPLDKAYGEVLKLMAAAGYPGIDERIRIGLDSASKRLQVLATEAATVLAGVRDAHQVVCDRLDERGWEGLTTAQRVHFCASMLKAEVDNGGFSQYFFNSYSDHWPEALDALDAIGAPVARGLLEKAVRCFGPQGPSRDHSVRRRELAVNIDRLEAQLSRLDNEFYQDADGYEQRLNLYVARHAEDFR